MWASISSFNYSKGRREGRKKEKEGWGEKGWRQREDMGWGDEACQAKDALKFT